eukprot:10756170-Prorocentrum_lima.AAC.1
MGSTAAPAAAAGSARPAPAGASAIGLCAGTGSPEEAATPGVYPPMRPPKFRGSTSSGRVTMAARAASKL